MTCFGIEIIASSAAAQTATGPADLTSATAIATRSAPHLHWTEADSAWERNQEQALHAFRDGQTASATTCWDRGYKIADQHFERGDPRLAASCTNQAFALIRAQQTQQARTLFQAAIRCWEESWRWVPLMVPPRTNRLQCDVQYDDETQREFYHFVKRGQSITEALERDQCVPFGGLEDWQEHKPKTMCDVRKLMASVFLIVSQAP